MAGLFNFGEMARVAQRQGSYLARAARMMVGIPDYDQYLAHMRTAHPGVAPMSYEEFFKNRLQARYGSGRGGCC